MTPPCHRQGTFGRGTLLATACTARTRAGIWGVSGMTRQLVGTALAAVLATSLVACSQSSSEGPAPGQQSRSSAATVQPAPAVVSAADYHHVTFTARSAQLSNPWMAMRVGRQWDYHGSAIGDHGRIRRRVVATVTDLTKMIGGVRTAVVYEEDFDSGQLVEAELTFYAQDAAGNVWHVGEYPEDYEHGRFVDAQPWIDGIDGATAGVMMRAHPQTGTPAYAEGHAPPPLNWDDHAVVHRTGERMCVPTGCYHHVIDVAEFQPSIPHAFQHKFYAPGVGNISTGWSGANEDDHEVLHLTRLRQLTQAQLARVDDVALALQASAYRHSPDVYGKTAPAR